MSGWYNDNMKVETSLGTAVVRVPKWTMNFDPEPRMFDEGSVLTCLDLLNIPVPTPLFVSSSFQVHNYILGDNLGKVFPEGSSLPGEVDESIRKIEAAVRVVERSSLTLIPTEKRFYRSPYRDSAAFALEMRRWLSYVYENSTVVSKALLSKVGVPDNPFTESVTLADRGRPLRLCHGDLGRGNCLWDGRTLSVLDWELALWADPAWDLASYLHRFVFNHIQEYEILENRTEMQRPQYANDFLEDVASYRRQEIDRSVVIDGIRLANSWGSYDSSLIDEYVRKVRRLKKTIDLPPSTADEVIRILKSS